MNYHNITTDDILNGDGLRTVLWVAGCDHKCPGCQNPITWDVNGGLRFDWSAKNELLNDLDKPYISGITFSGGDPLHPDNRDDVMELIKDIRYIFENDKTIWLYTGYLWEQVNDISGIENVDVLVDGVYVKALNDITYPWAGSTNQRVIDVKRSLKSGAVILHTNK